MYIAQLKAFPVSDTYQVRPIKAFPFVDLSRFRHDTDQAIAWIYHQLYEEEHSSSLRKLLFLLVQLTPDFASNLFEAEYLPCFQSATGLVSLLNSVIEAHLDNALVFIYRIDTEWLILPHVYSYAEVSERLSRSEDASSCEWLCISTDIDGFLAGFDAYSWVGKNAEFPEVGQPPLELPEEALEGVRTLPD